LVQNKSEKAKAIWISIIKSNRRNSWYHFIGLVVHAENWSIGSVVSVILERPVERNCFHLDFRSGEQNIVFREVFAKTSAFRGMVFQSV
jgi:hypothetical protein